MKTTLSRARVGFLIFIGMLAFSIGIFFIGEKSQLFSSVFYVQVNFSNAEGVKPGAYVVLSGYNIGTVSSITLTESADSVRLLLRLDTDIRKFIKSDSKAEIKQEGLVGNKYISLSIGSAKAGAVEDYGYIEGVPPFALGGLTENVTAITDTARMVTAELNRLLRSINEGKGTVGRLFTDDELYNNLISISAETQTGLKKTNQQLDNLSQLLRGTITVVDRIALRADTALMNTSRLTNSTALIVEDMHNGRGTVGALLKDRELYDTLVTLLTALTDVSYDASNAASQAARGIHAMREHWLFGRVFAGEEFENEEPMQSSYNRRMLELQRKLRELEQREQQLRKREEEVGMKPGR